MSQLRRVLVFVCSGCLVLTPAIAQQSQPLYQDAQGLQLGSQSLIAQGATGSLVPIRATGTIHSEDASPDGTFELLVTGPRVYRTTITRGDDSYVYTVNGDAGIVVHNGKKHLLPNAHVMSGWCPYLPTFGFLTELQQGLLPVEAPKNGSVSGSATLILATTTVDSIDPDNVMTSRSELEVDAKTFLPLKFRTLLRNHAYPQIASNLEYTYADYRQEGPYVLP